MGRRMRRLLLGVTLLSVVAALLSAPAAAGLNGRDAKAWARQLAQLGSRPAGGDNERQAARIVRRQLRALGYDVKTMHFPLPEGGRSLNAVGRTPGPIEVIIVAHMDGVPGTSAANDNGSGVGVMLEVAEALRNERGVLVAAVGAEERRYTGAGYHLGSRALSRSLTRSQRERVRLAVSVDMVGVGSTLNIRGLEDRPNRSSRKLLNAAGRLGVRASYLEDTGQSDHDEFTKRGVPATWIEWRWDDCWHLPRDRLERLRPWRLWQAARVVREGALKVLD
jgi:hypothetical protein